MAQGDIDALLEIYDPEVVFLNRLAEAKRGRQELREELVPLAAAKPSFQFKIRQVIQAGDIALMHTEWNASAPLETSQYAIEVARRQADGSWCWLIGDPFTVGRYTKSQPVPGV
jgi:ketosteroid isomerase-like protein